MKNSITVLYFCNFKQMVLQDCCSCCLINPRHLSQYKLEFAEITTANQCVI